MTTDTIVMEMEDSDDLEEESRGVGLLLERGILRRDDDFGGHEVKRRSLIATSQITIMHSPDPEIPALPAIPGSEAWLELRQSYLFDKERILRQQHIEATQALENLISAAEQKQTALYCRGPPSIYAFYERLQRLFSALNRTVAPLFNGRKRVPFLNDLCSPPQLSDQTFDKEFIGPWTEQGKRAIRLALEEIRRQTDCLKAIVRDVSEESPMEDCPANGRPWTLDDEYDTYFTRKADPKSCSSLLDCISYCTDALLGRGIFDFAVPAVSRGACDEGEGTMSGSSTTLSFSKMLLPDTWQLVRKAPLFRGHVDGADLMHEIASKLQPLLFSDNTLIIKQGTIGMSMYFINWGECSVQGNGSTLATRVPGEFFGELALTMAQERMADVLAQGTCELFELSRQDFRDIIKKYPHVYKRIAAVGTARVKREHWTDRLSEMGKVELLDDDELRECANDLSEVTESLGQSDGTTGKRRQSLEAALSADAAGDPAGGGKAGHATAAAAAASTSSRVDTCSECMVKFTEALWRPLGGEHNGGAADGMLRAMASLLQRVSLSAGAAICRRGDACDGLYIVERGDVTLSVNGSEVQRLGCGGFFGELSLVFSGTHVVDAAVGPAAGGASLFQLSKKDLLLVIERHPLLYDLLREQAALDYNLVQLAAARWVALLRRAAAASPGLADALAVYVAALHRRGRCPASVVAQISAAAASARLTWSLGAG